MDKKLLKKVQVLSGKTAGVVARQTLAIAEKASHMPNLIRMKTLGTVQVTGKTLRIRRLRKELKKRERKRLALFTNFGKAIFKLVRSRPGKIWQRKDIKGFLRELRRCEAEMEWVKAQISEIEERGKEQYDYREAILSLNSKEKEVRLAAVKSLEFLGEKDVIPILSRKLEDSDLRVRRETARILHKIIDRICPQ